ncbi:DUF5983 family protein [Klebsiella sp. R390]|uniref:DUF5983 family protein n=1 Tax=Klebsiella sp. R390 TaxID=2755400 RepID=UPI003DA7F7D1
MKFSLNVEADSINVLTLKMGRIAVEVDGGELTELINVVSDNGYSLWIANTPGKLIVEDPLPESARTHGIQCSTAHITPKDNTILDQLSLQHHDGNNSDWVLYTGYGYLLRLNARSLYPVLKLKRMGLSKACRRLVVTLMRRYSADIIHFDASGELLPDFATFDW